MLALLLIAAASGGANDTAWRLNRRTDPISDTAQIYAVIGDQRRHLAIGCDRDVALGLALVFKSDKYLGSERRGILAGGREITLRFDDRAPIKWRADYDDEGVTETTPRYVQQVIAEARQSRRLVIRALKYDGEQIDLAFEYDDPSSVIDQATAFCSDNERR